MACLGIRGGAGDLTLRKPAARFLDDRSGRVSGSDPVRSLKIPSLAAIVKPRISVAVNASPACVSDRRSASPFPKSPAETIVSCDDDEVRAGVDSPRALERLDEWMRDSVTEIVKNIRQAPLLVQIYADGKVKTEKAVAGGDWPRVVGATPSPPDGIILVEKLPDGNGDPEDRDGEFADGTRAFGVLIQGKVKGRDQCKSACYLLKTSSVNGGLGFLCSHFCLMKVNSFHQSAFSQLNDCWLLQ